MNNKKSKHICGDCKACCTVLGVSELEKPMYQTCNKVCASGCSIYQKRPKECQTYECFYFKNNYDAELRPDKLGVIIDIQETKLGLTIVAREVWPKASEQEKCRNLFDILMKNLDACVYIIGDNGYRSVLTPLNKKHLIQEVTNKIERKKL